MKIKSKAKPATISATAVLSTEPVSTNTLMDEIDSHISRVYSVLDAFEGEISPILEPISDEPALALPNTGVTPVASPLNERLIQIANRIDGLTWKIDALAGRLQL